MRRWLGLAAGLGLVAVVALAVVPVLARDDGPRTVEEQAECIGESWAAWLWDDCGEALAPETIAGPREELVEGLKARLKVRFEAPLNSEEYAVVKGCMMKGVDGYSASYLPLELELRAMVRQDLYDLDYYLAHPTLDHEIYTQVVQQAAEVLYVAQESLLAELMPFAPDADNGRRLILSGVLLGGVQPVVLLIGSPGPMFKRPYTPEEMAGLRAAAKRAAAEARAQLEDDALQLEAMADPEVVELNLHGTASYAAQQVFLALRQVFWDERPPVLSEEEQRELDEATAARFSPQPAFVTYESEVAPEGDAQ